MIKALGLLAVAAVLWLWLKGRSSSTGSAASAGSSSASSSSGSSGTTVLDSSALPPATGSGTGWNGLDNMMQGILQQEGGQPGNINMRNNNPGNLRAAPGMTGTSSGYATFADQGDGWTALQNYIQSTAAQNPTWDFYDFAQHYLGQTIGGPVSTNQGNSDNWANNVAGYMGVDPTTSVLTALYGS